MIQCLLIRVRELVAVYGARVDDSALVSLLLLLRLLVPEILATDLKKDRARLLAVPSSAELCRVAVVREFLVLDQLHGLIRIHSFEGHALLPAAVAEASVAAIRAGEGAAGWRQC